MRNLHQIITEREDREIDFNQYPEKLRQDYLDVFERV